MNHLETVYLCKTQIQTDKLEPLSL